jgi:hypothetical protein
MNKPKLINWRFELMKNIKIVDYDEDFTCECGNKSSLSGFYPCNDKGEYIEPTPEWEGFYKCDECNQVYLFKY